MGGRVSAFIDRLAILVERKVENDALDNHANYSHHEIRELAQYELEKLADRVFKAFMGEP